MKVGVISDTHGLLRPEALAALAGVEHILHAGDIGNPAILEALRAVAPLSAVRGNIDASGACAQLPATEYITLAGQNLYLLHDVGTLDLDPAAADVKAVVFGHSHKPLIDYRRGVLFFNPGAAGPRRFQLPISVGLLTIAADSLTPELLTLPTGR